MRNTKIHCTIGPSCNSSDTLAEMMRAGCDCMRINLSHGSAMSQNDKLKNFRKATEISRAWGCALMYDLRGPEIRITGIPEKGVIVSEGEYFTLHLPQLASKAETGMTVLIDDGRIKLEVESIEGSDIMCIVGVGGRVQNNKGVNAPDISPDMEYLGEKDREDLLFCIENNADYVAGSFIRNAEDVRAIKSFLADNGGEGIGVAAKIETKEAVRNLETIMEEADQILIARGDLGVEIGFERVPAVQKRIVEACRDKGMAVIIATQMMESMTESLTPTRAEVSDVANAVYDGATDLMLTGETASGRHPVEVIEAMDRIIRQAEKDVLK